ncbi:LysM peptidoglycan-binding domain-containing protein [Corallococcus carmarthensis]|uniref:Lysozyme g n=1 Tax=Corallococcus carmarthensis TaxID=2316728 RepID=A0A3A8JRM3_9BACT|nr:LysM peptidoglycan-binding domain-containing protein [Corallococcus carmarthensis]RKG98379.1 LysM peptidoglycan-binding domain-containing protein [Corallococcus carmarthensis]
MSQTLSIRRGDTLSALARQHGTTVDALAKANNLKDPNKILAGQKLVVPGGASRPQGTTAQTTQTTQQPTRQEQTSSRTADVFTPAQTPTTKSAQTFQDPVRADKRYPTKDGVPLYNQGDSDWENRRLGGAGTVDAKSRNSVQSQGCAISSTAMALSALSGRTITPREMDAYLDKSGGYSGNAVNFEKTGGVTGNDPRITAKRERGTMSPALIDQNLAAGKPVVLGVNYRTKDTAHPDHWITITGKNADGTYRANDPNGGKPITLRREGNSLVATSGNPYRSYGQGVTFTGGKPVRAAPQSSTSGDTFASGGVTGKPNPATAKAGGQVNLDAKQTGPTNAVNNDILGKVKTMGASAATAKQDKAPAGVEGSRKMAENDRSRLEKHKATLQKVAKETGLPSALLAAIASRESRGGGALKSDGTARYDPNGYGLMQIDKKQNPQLIKGGPYSEEHIREAANLLKRNLDTMKKVHPDWSEADQLRGAVSAYNRGVGEKSRPGVYGNTPDEMDRGNKARGIHASTGGDYSADVWARAQYLSEKGF